MEIKVVKTFKEAEQVWLGLDSQGHRRKVWRAVNEAQVGAKSITAGLTIFEPGERCASHSHLSGEEVNFVVKGGGIAIDVTNHKEARFALHDFIWIPRGVEHVHYNDLTEPLFLLWVYAPPDVLPSS